MEEKANLLETLIERVEDYGKTSIELLKLKAVDKLSDVVSALIPGSVVVLMMLTFLLFLNLGLAFWLGEILGKTFYGFFIIAGFYILIVIVIHFFMNKWLKKRIGDFIIKQMLK